MRTFSKMLKIEGKLSIRDMNMVLFAILMPVIVLIILGIVYGNRPAFEGAKYSFLEQSFGAISSIAICAGGLMGLPLMVSEYRERKILKRFQVTPVSPGMILGVHLCIYTMYSFASVVTLWIVAKLFWNFTMFGSPLRFLAGWLFVVLSIFSIGMLVGGIAKNSKTASIIASALYFPMLVFSGATLPYEVMPKTMQNVVAVFPLTQGIKILKAETLGQPVHNITMSVILLTVMTVMCVGISIKCFKWE